MINITFSSKAIGLYTVNVKCAGRKKCALYKILPKDSTHSFRNSRPHPVLKIKSHLGMGSKMCPVSVGVQWFYIFILDNDWFYMVYSSTRICCISSAGPKLYVKPSSKSNRHIITNAIAHCVLAGTVNQNSKDKVLQVSGRSVLQEGFREFWPCNVLLSGAVCTLGSVTDLDFLSYMTQVICQECLLLLCPSTTCRLLTYYLSCASSIKVVVWYVH